jgi:hypothetical protein
VTAFLEHSDQYSQALNAARTAFQEDLGGHDPIGGRVAFFNRGDASARPREYRNSTKAPIHSQFGPFRLNNREVYTLVNDDPLNMPGRVKKK